MTGVEAHVHVTVDEMGDPVRAYWTTVEAREAVDADGLRHAEETGWLANIPLMEADA